jgi:hypothetical protein
LRTYVYLSDERPHRVLAVGQDYVGGEAVRRVDLFEHRPSDLALPDKGKLLDAFFHNAFVRMRGRSLVRQLLNFEDYPASIRFYMAIKRWYLRTASYVVELTKFTLNQLAASWRQLPVVQRTSNQFA